MLVVKNLIRLHKRKLPGAVCIKLNYITNSEILVEINIFKLLLRIH